MSNPTPDTEGKPGQELCTCGHNKNLHGNIDICGGGCHCYKFREALPNADATPSAKAPAAPPANLADEGELRLRVQISEILVKWNMPTRQTAISEILNLIAAHDQALKSQLLAAVKELPRYRWGEDQLVLDRDEGGVISLQSTVNAINTVYKEVE